MQIDKPTVSDFTNAQHTHSSAAEGGVLQGSVLQGAISIADITMLLDGAGGTLSPGLAGYLIVDFDCVINSWTVVADLPGSLVVDVWACGYDAFDSGVTHPVAADSITGGVPPTLSSARKNKSTSLAPWSKNLTAGTVLAFVIESANLVTLATLVLEITKS